MLNLGKSGYYVPQISDEKVTFPDILSNFPILITREKNRLIQNGGYLPGHPANTPQDCQGKNEKLRPEVTAEV